MADVLLLQAPKAPVVPTVDNGSTVDVYLQSKPNPNDVYLYQPPGRDVTSVGGSRVQSLGANAVASTGGTISTSALGAANVGDIVGVLFDWAAGGHTLVSGSDTLNNQWNVVDTAAAANESGGLIWTQVTNPWVAGGNTITGSLRRWLSWWTYLRSVPYSIFCHRAGAGIRPGGHGAEHSAYTDHHK